jgi:hypothetical protein
MHRNARARLGALRRAAGLAQVFAPSSRPSSVRRQSNRSMRMRTGQYPRPCGPAHLCTGQVASPGSHRLRGQTGVGLRISEQPRSGSWPRQLVPRASWTSPESPPSHFSVLFDSETSRAEPMVPLTAPPLAIAQRAELVFHPIPSSLPPPSTDITYAFPRPL